MGKIYIHYGSDKFDINRFKPIKNIPAFTKPEGGLWGAPIDTPYNWKEWCISNDFHLQLLETSFVFTLKPNTKLLFIDDVAQLDDLPRATLPEPYSKFTSWVCLDFEKLSKEYDAVEITLSEEKHRPGEDKYWGGLYNQLYGWDCDSICIMNPDCIETNPEITIEPIVEQKPEEPGDTYKQYVCKGYKIKQNDETL